MNSRIYAVATVLALSTIHGHASAESYYVSASGSDSNPGTMAEPWETLAPIARVSPGDTVNVGDGTWTESMNVPAGTADARIVVQAWPGQTPVVDTTGMNGHSIRLGAYTDFIGVTVRNGLPVRDSEALVLVQGDSVVVRDCILRGRSPHDLVPGETRIRGSNFRQMAVFVRGNDVTIEDNDIADIYFNVLTFHRNSRRTRVLRNRIVNFGKNAFGVGETGGELRGLLIEGNHIEDSLSEDGLQTNGSFPYVAGSTPNRGIIIRNNFFRTFGENAVDLKGASHIVVEGNVFMRSEHDNDGLDDGMPHVNYARAAAGGTVNRGSNQSSGHVIIRNNVFFDNNGGIGMIGDRAEPFGWYAYNNTLAGNVRHAYVSNSTEVGSSAGVRVAAHRSTFVNNIVVGQNRSCIYIRTFPRNGYFNHNLYFDAPGVGWVEDVGEHDLDAWRAFLGTRDFGGRDMQAVWADPGFVDADLRPVGLPSEHDFNLEPGSPAVDAGQALTRAASGGSGRVLPVEDAGYFFDGYGVTEGDEIQVGASTLVRIASIDTAAQTLELERDISWADGDPVSLPYVGSAPDIGACEVGLDTCWFSTANEPPTVNAGPDVSGSPGTWIDLSGTAEDDGRPMTLSVVWRLDGAGTAEFEDESSANTRVRFTNAGTHLLVLSATDGELTTEDSLVALVGVDAGPPPDGGWPEPDGGWPDSGVAGSDDPPPGGCGCSVGREASPMTLVAFPLMGLFFAARRR